MFGEVAEGTGGYIQNLHLRAVIEGFGDADALAHSMRETHAALAHGDLVYLPQFVGYTVMQIGNFCSALVGMNVDIVVALAKDNISGDHVVG